MRRYLGVVEGGGLKTLPGCLLARQGRTKSGSGLWGLSLKVGCEVWRWGGRWFLQLGLLLLAHVCREGVAAACGAIPQQLTIRIKVKGPNIALNERTHLRATERHLSYGITQCYLPPDRGERASP